MADAINYDAMLAEIKEDAMNMLEFDEANAERFAETYVDDIISEMWSRYTDELYYFKEDYEPIKPIVQVGGE